MLGALHASIEAFIGFLAAGHDRGPASINQTSGSSEVPQEVYWKFDLWTDTTSHSMGQPTTPPMEEQGHNPCIRMSSTHSTPPLPREMLSYVAEVKEVVRKMAHFARNGAKSPKRGGRERPISLRIRAHLP